MPQNTHLELANSENERLPEPSGTLRDRSVLHASATEVAHRLAWLPSTRESNFFM